MKRLLLSVAVLGCTSMIKAEVSLNLPPQTYLVAQASSDLSAAGAPAITAAAAAPAKKYFRFIGDGPLQKSAGSLIAPKTPLSTALGADFGLITHSKADGSLCDKFHFGSWCVPESWIPLQLGAYGTINTDFILAPGTSANLAPQVGQLLLGWADKAQNPWAYAVKTAFSGEGSAAIRLGIVEAPLVVKGGVWQSPKEMFPGRGFFDIVGNLARLNVGVAW